MGEPKPFASLSSGLLARKGAAKPAMRPQGFGQMGVSLEDLGWNDMGHSQPAASAYAPERPELPAHVPSSIAALTPSPRLQAEDLPVQEQAPPPVVEQQRAIETIFVEQPKKPARRQAPQAAGYVAPAPRERSAASAKGRAAFTLRLDQERHLKLRLACALTNRSAQQLVTEALDKFLGSVPDLEALASQVPVTSSQRN